MYTRYLEKEIENRIGSGKAIVITGPRQVGKTTLIEKIEYKQSLARIYFWRTRQQQEVDFVEEHSGKIYGYEFKWNNRKKARLPITFLKTYKAESKVIDRNNFREFVVIKQS